MSHILSHEKRDFQIVVHILSLDVKKACLPIVQSQVGFSSTSRPISLLFSETFSRPFTCLGISFFPVPVHFYCFPRRSESIFSVSHVSVVLVTYDITSDLTFTRPNPTLPETFNTIPQIRNGRPVTESFTLGVRWS